MRRVGFTVVTQVLSYEKATECPFSIATGFRPSLGSPQGLYQEARETVTHEYTRHIRLVDPLDRYLIFVGDCLRGVGTVRTFTLPVEKQFKNSTKFRYFNFFNKKILKTPLRYSSAKACRIFDSLANGLGFQFSQRKDPTRHF
jgi:hypothetical protein